MKYNRNFQINIIEIKLRILIMISMEFVPRSNENISALIKEIDCRMVGAKPLSTPMMAKLSDADIYLKAFMSSI